MTNVWIISYSDNSSYNIKQIQSEFENRDISARILQFRAMSPFGEKLFDRDIKLPDVEELYEAPDLVFFNNSIKIDDQRSDRQRLVLNNLESMKPGTIFINDITPHVTASLKHRVYEILQEFGIVMPKTKVCYDWDASDSFVNQIIQEFPLPVVIKSTDGYGGSGTDLCKSSSELKTNLETRLAEPKGNQIPIIIQEYEEDSEGLMIKARVVGNKVEAVYRMYSPYTEESFKAEKEFGHMCIAMQVDEQLYSLVMAVSKALNIEVAWMDLFVSKGIYKFCEINVPGGIFNSIFNNTDFASEIVDYCQQKLKES